MNLPEQPETNVLAEIEAERKKQIAKGFDAAHDDRHKDQVIADAACELLLSYLRGPNGYAPIFKSWRTKLAIKLNSKPRRSLLVATALLVAEIERLDRKGGSHVR
jgi:hypothetical protein